MASGNITVTTSNMYISGILEWYSVRNRAGNYSDVTVTLKLSRTNTGYTTKRTPKITFTIDGSSQQVNATSQYDFTYNSNTNCGSWTKRVYHAADGTRSCNIKVSGVLEGSSNYTINAVSKTVTLDTIPRYPHISGIVIGAIGRDSMDLTFFSDSICDYWWYSFNGGSTWTGVGSINSSTAVTTITGLSANTTYNITVRIRRKDSQLTMSHTTTPATTLSLASPNTPTISSRTCIQAVMGWSSNRTVTALQYRLSGGAWKTAITFSARTSGSFTITGLTPGGTRPVAIRVKDAVHGTWSGASGDGSLTTHRLNTSSGASFSTGNSVAISLSRATTSVYSDVTLQVQNNSNSYINVATLTNQTSGATFSLSAAQLNTIYSNRINAKTTPVRFMIVNRWGSSGAIQGTSYSSVGTCTIANANPTIASVSYKDTNATIQAILNNNQKILRNLSTLQVVAGRATSQKYATLKSYKVSIGGSEYTVNTSGTSETGKVINVGKVNQSANQTAVLTVTDSRGYTASRSFTVQMLNYVAPQFIQTSADRLNNYEEPTTLNIDARRTVIKPSSTDVNTIEMRYRIKQNPSGGYGSYITLNAKKSNISDIYQNINVSQYMADYPNDKSYTIELGIKDKFTGWNNILITLTEGIALLRFLQDKIEVGVPIETSQDVIINNESVITQIDSKANRSYGSSLSLTLLNGWSGNLYVRKNDLNQVHIYGRITPGIKTASTPIAVLPTEMKHDSITTYLISGASNELFFISAVSGNFGIEITIPAAVNNIQINKLYQI